jgi:hypothetical protein
VEPQPQSACGGSDGLSMSWLHNGNVMAAVCGALLMRASRGSLPVIALDKKKITCLRVASTAPEAACILLD